MALLRVIEWLSDACRGHNIILAGAEASRPALTSFLKELQSRPFGRICTPRSIVDRVVRTSVRLDLISLFSFQGIGAVSCLGL